MPGLVYRDCRDQHSSETARRFEGRPINSAALRQKSRAYRKRAPKTRRQHKNPPAAPKPASHRTAAECAGTAAVFPKTQCCSHATATKVVSRPRRAGNRQNCRTGAPAPRQLRHVGKGGSRGRAHKLRPQCAKQETEIADKSADRPKRRGGPPSPMEQSFAHTGPSSVR